MIAQQIQKTEMGQSLILLSDDPATWPDLQAWARMTGNSASKESQSKFIVVRQNQSYLDDH